MNVIEAVYEPFRMTSKRPESPINTQLPHLKLQLKAGITSGLHVSSSAFRETDR